MDNLLSRIKQKAESCKSNEIFTGCEWSERIPAFCSGALDKVTHANVSEHLKSCEECNLLMIVLSEQSELSPPAHNACDSVIKNTSAWLRQGAGFVFGEIVSLFSAKPQPAFAMRSQEIQHSITEKEFGLLDGDKLYIRIVKQGEKNIATAYLKSEAVCSYDLTDESQNIIKCSDNVKQFKFEVPQSQFSLSLRGKRGFYLIKFTGDNFYE